MTENPKSNKDKAAEERREREAKLAQALRQNLRRRKAGPAASPKD